MKKTFLAILILLIQSCAPNMLENLGLKKTSFNESSDEYSAPTNQLNKTRELLDGASITFPTLRQLDMLSFQHNQGKVLNKGV